MNFMTKIRSRRRFPGCVEVVCREQMRHRDCILCGGLTDGSSLIIDEGSLRRTRRPMCMKCSLNRSHPFHKRQNRLRSERTKRDLGKLTDPTPRGLLREEMPEQYSSKARAVIRAFHESGFEFAAVADSDAASLSGSLAVLGLSNEIYVETRDGETILRRVS